MKLITSDVINDLIVRAGASARQRTNLNLHEVPSDPVQRLFVASGLESYFRPHRHPGKWEFAFVIRGLFDVMVFDDAGRVMERITIGPEAEVLGFELPPGAWHSWVPMTDKSVFFEVKQGPYDVQTASEFATWAPEEGSPHVNEFFAKLRDAKVGDLMA